MDACLSYQNYSDTSSKLLMAYINQGYNIYDYNYHRVLSTPINTHPCFVPPLITLSSTSVTAAKSVASLLIESFLISCLHWG